MGAVDRYIRERDARLPGFAEGVDRELAVIRSFDHFVNAARDRIAASDLTQAELAERAGIAPSNLSRLLNSTSGNPELDTLTRIAEALDCDLVMIPKDLPGAGAASELR